MSEWGRGRAPHTVAIVAADPRGENAAADAIALAGGAAGALLTWPTGDADSRLLLAGAADADALIVEVASAAAEPLASVLDACAMFAARGGAIIISFDPAQLDAVMPLKTQHMAPQRDNLPVIGGLRRSPQAIIDPPADLIARTSCAGQPELDLHLRNVDRARVRHLVGFGVTVYNLHELSTRPDLEGVRLTIIDPQRCKETQEIEPVETVLAWLRPWTKTTDRVDR